MHRKYLTQKKFHIELTDRSEWKEINYTHFHECYELYYLLEGEITYFIKENIYTLKKGSIVLVPPHTIHKTAPFTNPKHKRVLIYLTKDIIKEFLIYNPNLLDCFKHTVIVMSDQEELEILLQNLVNEYKRTNDEVVIKSFLGLLLTMINRYISAKSEAANIVQNDTISEKILEVVRYINTEFTNEISLSMLAEKFFMNPTYLSRNFKKVTGFNYVEYLNNLRIQKSIYLLLNSKQNVTSIAINSGFNSTNHFCKTFKTIVGISPLKYRKQ